MHTLLTIDRKGSLVPGQSITLTQPDYTKLLQADITLTPSIADAGFPDGLSRHGQRYLLNWSMKPRYKLHEDQEDRYLIYATPAIEAIFELVRAYEFPGLTSRFQSFFGSPTMVDLRKFAGQYVQSGTIYEVQAQKYSLFDMALVAPGYTIGHTLANARQYWSGSHSPDPILECLIDLPVTVGNEVGRYP